MSFDWLNRLSDRAILLLFFFGAIATSLFSLAVNLATEAKFTDWDEGWLQNFSTELFGAFFGFWLLGMIVEKRRQQEAEQEAREELKQQLIRQLGSKDNATALNAVDELKAHGWLYDGSLRGVELWYANLAGANLTKANLQEVDLFYADLQEAELWSVDLRRARILDAKLQGARVWKSNLQGATLAGSNLEGTVLAESNLLNVNTIDIKLDSRTTLPDRTKWTPDTDMTRFTDENHPDFWQHKWVKAGYDSMDAWIIAGRPDPDDTPNE